MTLIFYSEVDIITKLLMWRCTQAAEGCGFEIR